MRSTTLLQSMIMFLMSKLFLHFDFPVDMFMNFIVVCCVYSNDNTKKLPHVCYMYGDRHLIPFSKQPAGSHAQFHCPQEGTQTIISNEYVQGTTTVTINPSWKQHVNIYSFSILKKIRT